MNPNPKSENSEAAFTLTELCVVLVSFAILVLLVLPGLGASKTQSASTGCLYNLRHLQTGCAMYSTDNNDYLIPNAPLGSDSNKGAWISGLVAENWGNSPANTNPVYYTSALLWPYLGNNLSVFRCPGDVVPSANGTRIRSYSMNGQMGSVYYTLAVASYNPGWLLYAKASDIIRPTPANAFVFLDESPGSLNDGYMQVGLNSPIFPDVPACYLEGGCGFSFVDGHGEIHRWQNSSLRLPVRQGYNFVNVSAIHGVQDVDWLWLRQHASSK